MMRISTLRRTSLAAVAVLTATTALAACGSGGSSSDSKTVTIWSSNDQPVIDGLNKVLGPEAKKQGITVVFKKINNINQLVMTSIQANKAPDIAMIPQPGVVGDIVKRNKATALDNIVDMSSLKSSMTAGTLDAGTFNGKLYGLLVSMNVKSLVFYNKKAWAAAGYQVPTSLDELNTLTDKIKATGSYPWCMGIQDTGGASGWPATDWMEDLVMRYGGADKYNDWVSHKIPFDDPVVKQAGQEMEKLLFTSGNVAGGSKGAANSNWQTVANPMFASNTKPGCWMQKQGNFITGFYPKAVQADLDSDVGVFGFPPATAGGDDPTLGGGDLATLLNANASSKAVMKLMAQTNLGTEAAKSGDYLSPHKDFDTSVYPNTIIKGAAEVAYKSTQFLFDGSDAMPAAVGTGSFWKQMVAWFAGSVSLDDALKNIDQSWPSS
jgi:alpha-glucoside transport system substrate-binding protein